MAFEVKTYQMGSPRKRGEGLRIGCTRYLPRGVPKRDYARLNYMDVWLPSLAPSQELIQKLRRGGIKWPAFLKKYRREMEQTEPRQIIQMLALLGKKTPIAVGCYCAEESNCHRSMLIELIRKAAQSPS